MAVASLVCGILQCVPFIGVASVLLGAFAAYGIRASRGRLHGTGAALVGIGLGLFNVATSGIATAYVIGDDPLGLVGGGSPVITATPVPVAPPPPMPAPTAPGARPAPGAGQEGGQMTTVDRVTEVKIGAITLVDVPASTRSLAAELKSQQAQARAEKQKVVLFTTTLACRPCMSVAASLTDPKMQAALRQVRLIRVDHDELEQELTDLGVGSSKIPGFFLMNGDMVPVDGISGAEWDDDTASNISPVLGAFVKGTYRKRRDPEPFKTPTHAPLQRPRGPWLLCEGGGVRGG
jgi:hypothetical protein